MKFMVRFTAFCACVLAFGVAFFSSAQPVLAGCEAQFTIDSVTAYRDHIIINFTYSNVGSSPIQFAVTDGGIPVGSGIFSSATPGSFTIEFDLNSAIVQELDSLDVVGNPNVGCNISAKVTATGFFYGVKRLPQCGDGRINYDNCDKIAIFPIKDEGSFGIEVLIVDKKLVPEFAIFVSAADLKALPANPDNLITVATSKNGLVTLYKHPNGDYQVNYGPDYEGKVFTFRFNGVPALAYPEVTTFMLGALLPRFTPEIG